METKQKESAKPSRNVHSGTPELRHHQQSFLPQISLVLSATGRLELRLVSSAILEHTNNNTSHMWLGLVIVSNDRRTITSSAYTYLPLPAKVLLAPEKLYGKVLAANCKYLLYNLWDYLQCGSGNILYRRSIMKYFNIFYSHSPFSVVSRKVSVSFCRKNVQKYW